jgi:DNA repair photolyase
MRGERREWGRYLDAKVNAAEVYAAEHDRIRRSPHPSLRIYMSSVTDPYVPQERHYRITGRLLEAMRDRPPDLLALQTHTPHPLWDLDLLVELSRRFPVSVQISVETDREDLGPMFRPHAYSIASRLEALRRLRGQGLETVGVVAPMWPLADPSSFAQRLGEACAFVVVDHYLLGDGSPGGARTSGRLAAPGTTFPELLRRAGYEPWTRLEAFEQVVDLFRRVLGPERVGVSKEGFAKAVHRLLRDGRMPS